MCHKLNMARMIKSVGSNIKTFVSGLGGGVAKKETPGKFWCSLVVVDTIVHRACFG